MRHYISTLTLAIAAACGSAYADGDLPPPTITQARTSEAIVGHAENDIAITCAIRQSVIEDNRLTHEARNIKILSSGGVVTLRGSVATDAERRLIVANAEATSGVAKVESHLAVLGP